jgi:hypothetical protein
VLALHGKVAALVGTEPVEIVQPVGHRRAGDEGASPVLADGSGAASLPKALDEESVEGKIPLVREGAPLRSMQVKRQANRRHSLVAL